ncbi:hypothetical protein L210DRAFT_965505 [Boletus edulis BED1]|uniref:BRCT domain-containing protein n=1 Tax=Boletus edulis BED1 TaxID=1328754 RepID=A0AAD4G5B0_BOLED|nr:hypothetical protein L210DRAFT_965505 [Boletus edulis BED1]
MAPARSTRRAHNTQNAHPPSSDPQNAALFLEPMMGTPLTIYIEKDVDDRDVLVELVTKHGGAVSPSYSGTPYILVDPHKESGQNLFRQYAGKKGKIVLYSRWVHECVRAGALQTFQNNWADCKVTGSEKVDLPAVVSPQNDAASSAQVSSLPPIPPHPQALATMGPADPLVHPPPQGSYPYPVYAHPMHPPPRGIQPPTAAPPQSWQAPSAIAPQQTHMTAQPPSGMLPRPAQPYRDGPWVTGFEQPPPHMVGGPSGPSYAYRYRDEQTDWAAAAPGDYAYDPATYEQPYEQAPYIHEPGPSTTGSSNAPVDNINGEKSRGRKRSRNQGVPAAPPSTLVLNRRNPPTRSPTPPSRVIKSTYGGNLFTSDDVLYLKRYIDYCQEQGLVLSLREICERIAVKAPHHTFYSWRRYCNKHQIRLGGYSMDLGDTTTPQEEGEDQNGVEQQLRVSTGPGIIAAAQQRLQQEGNQPRNRSPTPPRALFRSTTGKGVAFTEQDVTFLVRFMEYRKSQDRFDMVAFWKDVATKAPHHSRASWMKFWRRHKHELNRTEGDDPLPQPPEKKMRYSRADDILLAKYFLTKPEGTSDKIFQAFGRLHPHHPWKGWQEHHRIHKAKIDHLIQRLANGENIDADDNTADSEV